MKNKKANKNLSFKKETIANLNDVHLKAIKGGSFVFEANGAAIMSAVAANCATTKKLTEIPEFCLGAAGTGNCGDNRPIYDQFD